VIANSSKLGALIAGAGLIGLLLLLSARADRGCGRAPETRTLVTQLAQGCEMFRIDHGRFPEKLIDLVHRPRYIEAAHWKQPYITGKPLDSWGREFVYDEYGFGFGIRSRGADGVERTGDDIVFRPVLCCEDGPTGGHSSR
jgi:hypothetical protein